MLKGILKIKKKKDNNYVRKSIQKHDIYHQAYSQTQNTLQLLI